MSSKVLNKLAKQVEESCEKYAQKRADLLCKYILEIEMGKYNQVQFEVIVKELRQQVFNHREVK